ncbi:MAG: Asp-tRNA(Asn)/Glu-tRNA(Gln) amidotransferase subunit GatB [Deltaproteobacteria bacterium]|nr:Asp-tRNA(Asn)/Glu-tRNA(Gln) amidotransferase subunit GatB [Deltaproteobacteria bacterium]
MEYELIICFETHVELGTNSKLFCDCPVVYNAPPNSAICPVCTGQPGALPVLNKKAVEYAVKAGIALNCRVNRLSRFARKNYFYPDLPKGYQISQYELPFCEDGYLEIPGDDGQPYQVGIKRIHLEEDAGKLIHSSESFDEADYSLVDYNRSSVPLLEIVTDHERNPMRSLTEARAYLEKLRQTLKYIEISECAMEKGQLRCDVNISIREKGAQDFGNRSEIKNMSSFRFIMEALEYEINRQKELIESGKEVKQETRLFDEVKKITIPMRSKEDAPDYRYFPDPDLLEVELDEDFVSGVTDTMPELPDQKLTMIIEKYNIPRNDAIVLTKDRAVSDYFIECIKTCADNRKLSNWIINELFKYLNDASILITACPVKPGDMARLINLITNGDLTEAIAKKVLSEMFETGKGPDRIIEEKDLKPVSDESLIHKILDEVAGENPDAISQLMAGETKPIDFLLGQVMRKTKGKANPKLVREKIIKKYNI